MESKKELDQVSLNPLLLQLKKKNPAPLDFNSYPIEIWVNVVSHLKRQDVSALMTTCSFMNNQAMQKIRNSLPKFEIVSGGFNSFALTSFGQLFGCGSNSTGLLGVGDKKN